MCAICTCTCTEKAEINELYELFSFFFCRYIDSDDEEFLTTKSRNLRKNNATSVSKTTPSVLDLDTASANSTAAAPAVQGAVSNSRQWKIVKAERQMQRFLRRQNRFALNIRSTTDYILDAGMLGFGTGSTVDDYDSDTVTSFSNIARKVKSQKHFAKIARKGEQSLGSLSAMERYDFFYSSTKSGFQEAMKCGRLPDGSSLKKLENDKFRDKYGIVRDRHGPFWPSSYGPMFGSPHFSRRTPNKVEPVLEKGGK